MKLIKNLQKVSVSDGKVLAIAFAETQLPPQIIMETTNKRLNSEVLFEVIYHVLHVRLFIRFYLLLRREKMSVSMMLIIIDVAIGK